MKQDDGLPSTRKIIVCGLVIGMLMGVAGFFLVQTMRISAERDKVLTEIEQQQETERTEERSQFWQKLIPWGSDEDEAGTSSN